MKAYYQKLIWFGIILSLVFVMFWVSGFLDILSAGCGAFMSLAGSLGAYIDMKEHIRREKRSP